ncbi:MAG: hypothetical protein H0W39_07705 [Sphingomonas sp.]|nr:hypothetical protein [Sphingomonas sp.]
MHRSLDWKAALWAGIAAGVVFMALEMLLVMLVKGDSPWAPPRMIAAMVMGKDVLPPPAPFDGGVMAVAMMIHMVLSVVLGLVLGWLISSWRLGMATAIIAGTLFGLIIYFVNFYLFTGIWPWFAMARGPISIFAHAAFGFVLGWVYRALESRTEYLHRADAEG